MKALKKIISYPLSVLHYLTFGLAIVIFHPIQWLALKIGYQPHKKSVDYLVFFLLTSIYVLGYKIRFVNKHKLPEGVPLIFVSNHQSLNDVTVLGWFLRKYHPKYVSKIELGKGIPSISFNLRHGGSVLIDRKDAKQSISAIIKFGEYLERTKRSAIIFPEGTRSKDGVPKRFSENGLKMLVKKTPTGYVVPVTINNSWKTVRYGHFPLEVFVDLSIEVHEPVKNSDLPFEELFLKVEKEIKDAVVV